MDELASLRTCLAFPSFNEDTMKLINDREKYKNKCNQNPPKNENLMKLIKPYLFYLAQVTVQLVRV